MAVLVLKHFNFAAVSAQTCDWERVKYDEYTAFSLTLSPSCVNTCLTLKHNINSYPCASETYIIYFILKYLNAAQVTHLAHTQKYLYSWNKSNIYIYMHRYKQICLFYIYNDCKHKQDNTKISKTQHYLSGNNVSQLITTTVIACCWETNMNQRKPWIKTENCFLYQHWKGGHVFRIVGAELSPPSLWAGPPGRGAARGCCRWPSGAPGHRGSRKGLLPGSPWIPAESWSALLSLR